MGISLQSVDSTLLMNTKRIILIVASAVILITAGLWIGSGVREVRERVQLARHGVPKYEPDSKWSDEHNAYVSWLMNDLGRSNSLNAWTDEDNIQRLMDVIQPPSLEEVEQFERSDLHREQERMMKFWLATGVVSEALRRGKPIPDILKGVLISNLDHPHWRIRQGAVQDVCYARLVADPDIRTKIESMFSDENDQVATNAYLQLEHYDRIEALRAEGKWRGP